MKGAVVRTASLAEIETCTIDEGHKGHKRITIAFQAGCAAATRCGCRNVRAAAAAGA